MDWNEVVNRVTPYVVKIETPEGKKRGRGFYAFTNESRSFCGVATAHHVVKKADEWQLQPIRIKHFPSKTDILLKEGDRVILLDPGTDSAVIP